MLDLRTSRRSLVAQGAEWINGSSIEKKAPCPTTKMTRGKGIYRKEVKLCRIRATPQPSPKLPPRCCGAASVNKELERISGPPWAFPAFATVCIVALLAITGYWSPCGRSFVHSMLQIKLGCYPSRLLSSCVAPSDMWLPQ